MIGKEVPEAALISGRVEPEDPRDVPKSQKCYDLSLFSATDRGFLGEILILEKKPRIDGTFDPGEYHVKSPICLRRWRIRKFKYAEMIDREVSEDTPPQRGCVFGNFRAEHLRTTGTPFFGSARLADAKCMSAD